MGAFSNPLLTGVFGPLLGTTNETNLPTQSSAIAGEQQGLFSVLNGMLNPATDRTLAPQRSADSASINRAYAGMPNTVTQRLASRGFGSSGKVGDALYDTEGARLGAQSQLYGKYAELGSQRQLSAAAIIESMLRNNTGHSATNTKGSLAGLTAIQQLLKLLQGGGSKAPSGLPSIPGLTLPPYSGTPPTFPSYPGGDGTGYGNPSGPGSDFQSYTDIVNQMLTQGGQAPLSGGGPVNINPTTGRPTILFGADDPANQTDGGGNVGSYWGDGWSGYVEGYGDNGYGDEE